MNDSRMVVAGAIIGAAVGAAATYLFFTDADLRREFARFQKTLEKVGEMASDGMRVVNEFNAARAQSSYTSPRTSH